MPVSDRKSLAGIRGCCAFYRRDVEVVDVTLMEDNDVPLPVEYIQA
jgi:hypothetical protein